MNNLEEFKENQEKEEIELIKNSKAIKKVEKHQILKEKILKRKHSTRLELARISVKQEKIFGNLENITRNQEKTPIKLSETY